MIRVMLDTNICIYVIKGADQALRQRLQAHQNDVCISAISLAELEYGVAKSSRKEANRRMLDAFLEDLPVLPFENEPARDYGDIKVGLFGAGTPIGPLDLLIAAHARALGVTLVTNNRREFDRVPGLSVENWLVNP